MFQYRYVPVSLCSSSAVVAPCRFSGVLFLLISVSQFLSRHVSVNSTMRWRARTLLEERRTCDRKVAGSIPGRSGGSIFFSRVNFLCWFLFGVRSTPVLRQWHVTIFCQKSRWQVTSKQECTLDPTSRQWADYTVQAQCGDLSGIRAYTQLIGELLSTAVSAR